MTAVSLTIRSKPFSRWLLSFALMLSLLSFVTPTALSVNVVNATSTEQLFSRRDYTNTGFNYLQYFSCQNNAENLRKQKNTIAGSKHSLRNFKTFTTLRFNHLLNQYSFYKSIIQFSACGILLLPAPEAHLS